MKKIQAVIHSGMVGDMLERGLIGPGNVNLSGGFRIVGIRRTDDDYPVDGIALTIEVLPTPATEGVEPMDTVVIAKSIDVGDIVRLKSGGPAMTVSGSHQDKIECVWFVGRELKSATFLFSTLTILIDHKADSE